MQHRQHCAVGRFGNRILCPLCGQFNCRGKAVGRETAVGKLRLTELVGHSPQGHSQDETRIAPGTAQRTGGHRLDHLGKSRRPVEGFNCTVSGFHGRVHVRTRVTVSHREHVDGVNAVALAAHPIHCLPRPAGSQQSAQAHAVVVCHVRFRQAVSEVSIGAVSCRAGAHEDIRLAFFARADSRPPYRSGVGWAAGEETVVFPTAEHP